MTFVNWKSFLFAGLSCAWPLCAAADNYTLDPNHTNVTWHANHFGFSNPSGKFAEVSGKLVLDEKNPQQSSLNVTINPASIHTGLEKFDTHLKSSDFLDAAKFATATFVSDKIELTGKDSAKVYGQFTVRGVTKPLTLDVKLNKIGESPLSKKKTAGFTATATIKRSDFGINYALPGVSDNVKIDIETEAVLDQ